MRDDAPETLDYHRPGREIRPFATRGQLIALAFAVVAFAVVAAMAWLFPMGG